MSKVFSYEDGNLNSSIRVTRKRVYSDVDLSFAAREVTDGDVYKKLDAAAVKQAIKTLILTNRFEKPYRPAFGANLGSKLFELADGNTGDEIIDSIKKSIERYEPRAKILNIKVYSNPDNNSLAVTLEFKVINSNVSETLNLDLRTPFKLEKALPVTPEVDQLTLLLQSESLNVMTTDGLEIAIDE
jgi:phage baseplate assembly protein W